MMQENKKNIVLAWNTDVISEAIWAKSKRIVVQWPFFTAPPRSC